MIAIGTIINIEGYTADVRIETSGSEVKAVVMLPFVGQGLTLLQMQRDTQVVVFLSEDRNIMLGVLPSNVDQPPSEFLVESVLKLIDTLQHPTPSGISGTPIPTNTTESKRLKEKVNEIPI